MLESHSIRKAGNHCFIPCYCRPWCLSTLAGFHNHTYYIDKTYQAIHDLQGVPESYMELKGLMLFVWNFLKDTMSKGCTAEETSVLSEMA